jgi:hypothetical protein
MRFRIPEDNLNTHLNESYVSFQVVPVDGNGDAIPVAASANLSFGNQDANIEYYASCLLKVVRLFRGDTNVPLEEIRHFNILDLNMKVYTKGFDDLISDQFDNGFVVENQFGAKQSSFFNEGSTFVFAEVHIPLKDIFGLCKNKDFHLSETGGLLIEFELEDTYKLFIKDDTPFKTFPAQSLNPVPTPVSIQNAIYNPLMGSGNPVALGVEETNITVSDDPKEWKPVVIGTNTFTLGALDATTKTLAGSTFTLAMAPVTLKNKTITNCVGNTQQNTIINAADINIPAFISYRAVAVDEYFTAPLVNWKITTEWAAPATACVITGNVVMPALGADVTIDDVTVVFAHTLTSLKKWIYLDACIATAPPTNIPVNYAIIGDNFIGDFLNNNAKVAYVRNTGMASAEMTVTGAFNNGQVLVEGKQYDLFYRILFADKAEDSKYIGVKPGFANCVTSTSFQKITGTSNASLVSECTDVDGTLSFGATVTKIGSPKTGYTKTNPYGQIYLRMRGSTSTTALEDFTNAEVSYQIPKAELVLFQSEKQTTDVMPSVYKTWKWEAANIEYEVEVWNRQFILEPNVYNCYAMFLSLDEDTPSNNSMASGMNNLNAYRWAINNIDNTNRDVNTDGKLHKDKLIDTFNNSDVPLKNLEVYQNGGELIPMKIFEARDDSNIYMNDVACTLQLKMVALAGEKLDRVPVYLFKELFKHL